jgi:hypothetical protein
MNLLEAAKRVDRTEANKNYADFSELGMELDFPHQDFNWTEFHAEVNEFWLTKRLVSHDTEVGISVGLIGDEVVYIRTVSGRKSSPHYAFVSNEAAERVRQALQRHCTVEMNITLLNPAMDIDDFYSASHGDQIQVERGFYNGVPVTHNLRAGWQALNGRDIFVLIDETQEKITIPCIEFLMPLHLAPSES